MGIFDKIEVAMIAIDEAMIVEIPVNFDNIRHPMMAKKLSKKCAVRAVALLIKPLAFLIF